MSKILKRLKEHWHTHGTRPASATASKEEIVQWEEQYGVRLPDDLREYVSTLNGIHGGENLEFDSDCFSFLPLAAMEPETEWSGRDQPRNMFVFVDYLIRSYWYCVELDDREHATTRVFLGGALPHEDHRLLADSLKDFFELYMAESHVLYPTAPGDGK